jgi:putative spermidine/putrescine transport system ATP-binding protein
VCGNDEFIVKIPNAHSQARIAKGETVRIGWAMEDCRALDA